MKLRHFLFLLTLILSCKVSAQLKEPKSDPAFNDDPPASTEDTIDDAAEVKLRPSPVKVVEKDNDDEDDDKPKKSTAKVAPDNSPSAKFSVTTFRIGSQKTSSRNIQLVSPQHNSTYTPGVITFSWRVTNPPKKSKGVILKVERVDGKKKYSRKVFKEKKLLELSPGEYKWQVATDKTTQTSKWRLFKVIGMKSHSVTGLYNGKSPTNKKPPETVPLPDVSDYIFDMDGPDDEEREPAADPGPPLAPPSWIKAHPTN